MRLGEAEGNKRGFLFQIWNKAKVGSRACPSLPFPGLTLRLRSGQAGLASAAADGAAALSVPGGAGAPDVLFPLSS